MGYVVMAPSFHGVDCGEETVWVTVTTFSRGRRGEVRAVAARSKSEAIEECMIDNAEQLHVWR